MKYLPFSLLMLLLGINSNLANAQASIEGKWKEPKNGSTILIYEEGGFYYGQLIGNEKATENEKIQAQDKIILLKDFQKEDETTFCCGTIYQPRTKKTISATLTLEGEGSLKVTGQVGAIKRSRVWQRL